MIEIKDAIELLSGILDTADNREKSHLRFDDDMYTEKYCENNCPAILDGQDCDGYGCRNWEDSLKAGMRKTSAADILIEAVLKHGYYSLGISGIDKPCEYDETGCVSMNWDDTYEGGMSFCGKCRMNDKSECPEDIFSTECPYHKSAWAIQRITETLNEIV